MSSSASVASGAPETDAVELRASVLDAAISLGFRNSVMKRWMFESVDEADEEESEERSTPALTSPSTSEESSLSPYSMCLPAHFNPDQSGGNVNVQTYMDPHFVGAGNGGTRSVWDEDEDMDNTKGKGGLAGRIALAVPPPKNKLKKQKVGCGDESDAGYVSDGPKKAKTKTKKGMGWMRREKVEEDEDSDTGYRSDAVFGNKKKTARKEKNIKARDVGYPLPLGNHRDPGALLATINASVLPESSSDNGHQDQGAHNLDGYLTDSFSAEKRGRTKTKTKPSKTKEKGKKITATSPPPAGDDDSHTNTPTKKRSLFRLMARSASREGGKERELKSPENEVPPPLPPMPPLPLPIADRFARSGTPVSNVSSTAVGLRIDTGPGLGPGPGLVKSSSSMELGSGSSTIRPFDDSLAPRSESPWSYRSAPSRMGTASNDVWGRGGSEDSAGFNASLDLPREENGMASPFVMINSPAEGEAGANGNGSGNGWASKVVQREKDHLASPPSAMSPTTGPESSRAPSRLGRLFAFGHSAINGSNGTSKVSVPAPAPDISLPNPHGEENPAPDPLDIASALTAAGTTRGGSSPTALGAKARNGQGPFGASEGRAESPGSFIVIEEEGVPTPVRQLVFDSTSPTRSTELNEQSSSMSSSYLSPTSNTYGSTTSPSSPTRSGLAARRRAPMNGLDITPTQSRVGTPTPLPDDEDVRNARANVLAYYQVPPPSPPPTGPLPAPPGASGSASYFESQNQSYKPDGEKQLLAPGRAYASRSPSPLGPGARYTPSSSRSPSPGMMMMMMATAQSVRRGRESPFPTRPVLPPQNSRELVERVERYKTLYSGDGANGEGEGEEGEEAYASSEEFVDTRSSAYIREARARGEKRVYFDIRKSGEGYGMMTPEIEIEDADADAGPYPYPGLGPDVVGDDYLDFGEDGDGDEDDMRYARSALGPSSLENVNENENEDGDEELLGSDRRSFASMSVYSRYSVLDEDKSAEVREGFVKRIAALYGGRDQDQEEIPDVPKIPAGLRDRELGRGGTEGVKVASSPYRF